MSLNLYKRYFSVGTAPTEYICRRIVIPNDDTVIWALNDVLRMLCSELVWIDESGLSALDMHSLMAEVLLSFKDIDCEPNDMSIGVAHIDWTGLRPLSGTWAYLYRNEGYMTLRLADDGTVFVPILPGDYEFRLIYHRRSTLNSTSLIFRANSTYLFDLDLHNDGTQLQDNVYYIDGGDTVPDGSDHLRIEQSVNNQFAQLLALQIRAV